MQRKTVLTIVIGIIVVIAIAFGIAFYFLQPKTPSDGTNDDDTTIPSVRPPITTPGGGGTATSSPSPSTNPGYTPSPTSGTTSFIPALRQISTQPVAGAVLFTGSRITSNSLLSDTSGTAPSPKTSPNPLQKTSVIRYMEKATGHVYETNRDSFINTRLTSTRIPKVAEAIWIKDGSSVLARYTDENTDTIQTFYGEIKSAPEVATSSTDISGDIQFTPRELKGGFLARNIQQITAAPNKKAIFFTAGKSSITGTTARPDGSQAKDIFQSPISEWLASWIAPTVIALQSRPSGLVYGFVYYLNPDTSPLPRMLGGKGIVALPNRDGSLIVASIMDGSDIATYVFNTKTGAKTIIPSTIADKCVWGKKDKAILICAVPRSAPNEVYPDAWYQGIVQFDDRIARIDLATGQGEIIVDPAANVLVKTDAVNLDMSDDDNYIIFTNKSDGTLWGLFLNRE